MEKLILASASPRRKELLEQVGITPIIIPSSIDESQVQAEPVKLAELLSRLKAEDVGKRDEVLPGDIVLGADTIVVKDNVIFGKPGTKERAVCMLRSLSGGTHYVYTGVTLLKKDKKGSQIMSFTERTEVEMYSISEEEIKNYVETEDCLDKAGAYGIQGRFAVFIKKINGDYPNIVGLPIARVYQSLKGFNFSIGGYGHE